MGLNHISVLIVQIPLCVLTFTITVLLRYAHHFVLLKTFLFLSSLVLALGSHGLSLCMCVAESIFLPSFHPFHVLRGTAKRTHWYSELSALRLHWLFMLWHLEAQGVDANIYLSFLIFNGALFHSATAGSFLLPSYIWKKCLCLISFVLNKSIN